MAWFKNKADPLSDRARALNDEIAELESQIKKLDARLQENPSHPRLRSTAIPHGATLDHSSSAVSAPAQRVPAPPHEPIFEDVGKDRLNGKNDAATPAAHYNDLGMRKYDLPALLRRVRDQFRGPSTTNPKLVSYLAAGGIQGLRPLRYEKRVARNRFILLVVFLFLVMLGLIAVFARRI
jgi:hypothetical protein